MTHVYYQCAVKHGTCWVDEGPKVSDSTSDNFRQFFDSLKKEFGSNCKIVRHTEEDFITGSNL